MPRLKLAGQTVDRNIVVRHSRAQLQAPVLGESKIALSQFDLLGRGKDGVTASKKRRDCGRTPSGAQAQWQQEPRREEPYLRRTVRFHSHRNLLPSTHLTSCRA